MINKTPLEDIKDHGYWKQPDKPPPEVRVKRIRTLYKTLSWRIVASLDTFLISWLVTGYFLLASTIASVEVVTKMGLYYGHERLWQRIKLHRPW